jgi:hypothetical protein
MTRRSAWFLTTAIVLAALGFVLALSDVPIPSRGNGARAGSVAALAVRDHVVPFQKWGTKLFTLPALERHYDEVAYFTQRWQGDRTTDLLTSLSDLLSRHDQVDLFVLAHSNTLVLDVEGLDPERRKRLRLVYDTGCADAVQARHWLELGADVHVGHPGATSISPVFYFYFLRRWLAGWDVREAASEANQKTASRLASIGPLLANYAGSADLARSTVALVSGDDGLRHRP